MHGLPPLLIHAGNDEILLDDSTRLAERAAAAGVDVTLKIWQASGTPSMPSTHGSQRRIAPTGRSANGSQPRRKERSPMIRSADVRSNAEARRWEARLNRDRPRRSRVAAWIVSQIDSPPAGSPRVVELACGAGFLAEALFQELPAARYCGFDQSPHLLDYARGRLAAEETGASTDRAVAFRCADLVNCDWENALFELGWAGQVDAVISMQALHDLGGLEQQTAVLTRSHSLLRAGGQLVYGDLLLDADDPHPSRFTEGQHEEMLRAAGFAPAPAGRGTAGAAAVRFGDFGCFTRSK